MITQKTSLNCSTPIPGFWLRIPQQTVANSCQPFACGSVLEESQSHRSKGERCALRVAGQEVDDEEKQIEDFRQLRE